MASKRKSEEDSGALPHKKSRIVLADETSEEGWASGDSGDYKVNFTDNGARRADSEARRQWNYVCPVQGCAQRFNRPCRLESHMRSHNKERPFACPEVGCDKTFPRKDHLQRHRKNAHGDPDTERTFTCDWNGCGKSFTSNGRLQRHMDAHESKFYCTDYPPCNQAFRKEKALDAHVKSQHMEVKPYPCTHIDQETGDKCNAGFQTEGALHRHMSRVHSEGQPEEHVCLLCVTLGTDMERLQTESGENIIMPIDPPSFTKSEELAAHVEACHPPVCSECGQKFKSASTLKSHFDTVHGDPAKQPRYPCPKPDCDSVFNRKHNLTVHIQTVHDQQVRYFCTSDALQTSKHVDLQSWTGENACGAAFKAKSSLEQHVRTHHLGLGTRKELRKAAKSKKKPNPSMLTLLTGVGYEEGRDVPCLLPPCEYRFYMDRDLRRHLRAAHNLSQQDADDLIRERDAITGGQFWIGGLNDDNDPIDPFESRDPSMPQTPQLYTSLQTKMDSRDPDAFSKFPDNPFTYPDHAFDPSFDPQIQFEHPHQYQLQHPHHQHQHQHHTLLIDDADAELDLDLEMGLAGLPSATDVQHGLDNDNITLPGSTLDQDLIIPWHPLAPVEQFNSDYTLTTPPPPPPPPPPPRTSPSPPPHTTTPK